MAGVLETIQSSISTYIDAATGKAVDDLKGQSTPLPDTLIIPASAAPTPASLSSSTTTMLIGAVLIGAMIFAYKKARS